MLTTATLSQPNSAPSVLHPAPEGMQSEMMIGLALAPRRGDKRKTKRIVAMKPVHRRHRDQTQ